MTRTVAFYGLYLTTYLARQPPQEFNNGYLYFTVWIFLSIFYYSMISEILKLFLCCACT